MMTSAAASLVTREPAQPDRVVAEVAPLQGAAVDGWLTRAVEHLTDWSADAPSRARALHDWAQELDARSDELAILITREVGKTIRESRAEVARGVAIMRYYAQAAFDPAGEILPGPTPDVAVSIRRVPLGIVAAICPWNFPFAIPIWKIAAALAYGNAVLFKPASAAIGVGQELVAAARGVPHTALLFAPMRAADAARVVDDHRIAGVSFTGSSEVGSGVIQRGAARGIPVQAEMGGQNASIVLDDADVSRAATVIAEAAMGYAGQKCTATRRVIVAEAIANEMTEALQEAVRSLAVGDPLQDATDVGPLISAAARSNVHNAVAGISARGAALLNGGAPAELDGWFYQPTVAAVRDLADPFLHAETFGPVAAVVSAHDDDEAIAIANSTEYGLSAAVFARDVSRAQRVADRLDVGMIRINSSTTGADFWAPFGGEGRSGYGPREQGRETREFFTKTRTVSTARA